jgi:L-alanine-DL-glutamate epimerase-like enolase superfamily enzyme
MKITSITMHIVDGGFRPWNFVEVKTDEGITGWGDATDWDAPESIAAALSYMEGFLIGENPLDIERIWTIGSRVFRRMTGGIAWKALSGIDTALWDILGKYLNTPVWRLLGGQMQTKLRLYWTHCASARHFYRRFLTSDPILCLDDLVNFAPEIKKRGFTALKTNIMPLRGTALAEKTGCAIEVGPHGMADDALIETAQAILGVFRSVLGKDIEIALDIAFRLKLGGAIRFARAMEPYRLMWLETETFDVQALKTVRNSTSTPIVHGESLYDLNGYCPFLAAHAQDAIMIDLAWNGITQGRKIAALAQAYDTPISPHNCHSPLQTVIASHFAIATANHYILEIDVDDVPWRDEILTHPLEIDDGYLTVSNRPGWGTAPVMEVVDVHKGWTSFKKPVFDKR